MTSGIALGLSDGQERFRDELDRLFAQAEMAGALQRVWNSVRQEAPDPRPVYRVLGRHRLLAADWPVDVGGGGRAPVEQALVIEEIVRQGVPDTLLVLSIQIVGQILRRFGRPDRNVSLLPRLARGETFATVLYSEPEAGSDLAALTTRAEALANGSYLLRGHKVHSVGSHLAQYGLCAVRTADEASKYAGLTLFLLPLDADGVRVETVASLGDEAFCSVTLDGVQVGEDAVIGEVGQAWSLIVRALALERTGVEHAARCRHWLDILTRVASDAPTDGLLEAVGRAGAEADAGRLLSWVALQGVRGGGGEDVAAASAKWFTSEAARRAAWRLAEALGPGARHDAPMADVAEAAYREAPGLTISAGTSEMMLQLVAGAGLDGTQLVVDPLQGQLRTATRSLVARAGSGDDLWTSLAELGVFELAVPGAAGLDLGQLALVPVCEELGRALAGATWLDTFTAADCLASGSPHLADLVAGRLRVSLAVVEGEAAPAPWGWSLDGHAGMVAAARRADRLMVVAPAGSATRVFLVPAGRPGCSLRPSTTTFGAELDELDLRGLRLEPGDELAVACPDGELPATILGRAHLRMAAYLVGLAAGALDATVGRARERRQFGRALVENQAIGFRLAALHCRVSAAGLLAAHAAWLDDAGRPALVAATEALAMATELSLDVTREGMQVHGAFGSTGDPYIQRCYLRALTEVRRAGGRTNLWLRAGRLRIGNGDSETARDVG